MNRKPNKDSEILRADILKFLQENEKVIVPLSIRDIQEKFGLSSTSIADYHLEQLARQGKIKRHDGKSRFIELVKDVQEP